MEFLKVFMINVVIIIQKTKKKLSLKGS
uniref:Uncharacterized protein n=1 Tax=Anguilla anguilla TaxID=7936 RepID=A0A0E9Q1Y2_ANGAN